IRLFGWLQVEAFGSRRGPRPLPDVARFLSLLAHDLDGLPFERLAARMYPSFLPRPAISRLQLTSRDVRAWAGADLLRVNNGMIQLNPDRQILVDVDLWTQLLD